MEPVGSISEGEWISSLNGLYTNEEADFMAQLLNNNPPFTNHIEGCFNYWPGHEPTIISPNLLHFSLGSSSSGASGSSCFPSSSSDGNYFLNGSDQRGTANNNSSMPIGFFQDDAKATSSYLVDEDDCLNQERNRGSGDQVPGGSQPDEAGMEAEKNADSQVSEPAEEYRNVSGSKRRSLNAEVQRNKKNTRSRKNLKLASNGNNGEEGNGSTSNRQSSSTCCSEDESNASQDDHATLNSNGKSRASRGTATDPQSLYARKRRERINERLRILQSLVPNGTKVDISTMLEEAVQYVKFLQLQIKLLSSDDLWMYAPIAYNGMNIGLDLKIPTLPPKGP